jgi:diaminohydroxyphosphoribosylaminopyrimidine deaminase/5-amino-6-(5-phosphoribosylamino)uracil reductase
MNAPGRPTVTLKLATSLDGQVALADGTSKWITGPEARAEVHEMRAAHDAVMTGITTLLVDDAELTARPGGALADRQPLRVVMDTRLRCRPDSAFLRAGPAILVHGPGVDPSELITAGADCREVALEASGRADFHEALEVLSTLGVRSVMIEAGGVLAASALAEGVVDRIAWFRAPKIIGGDGRPCVAALNLEALEDGPIFTRVSVREVGADLLELYERA